MNTACCAKLHGSLSGPCESAGSGMNKAFCRKDLPQDRTTWMEHHQTPLPFYGKGHVERDMAGFIQSRVTGGLPTMETPPHFLHREPLVVLSTGQEQWLRDITFDINCPLAPVLHIYKNLLRQLSGSKFE
ncbi:hypothetical protein NC652_029028 [Populus alba x Populus x berolinensis]|nr:hypothetical protein NC652_029028 [Populus alba x Populus x berolinensis]